MTVLDLSKVLAGPYATQQLADLGAQVWKIERPGTGDDTRAFGPPFVGGESTYFLSVNRGKRSLALNMKAKAGVEVLRRLAARADVVIENLRPGALDRILPLSELRERHPALITCSISGWGTAGLAEFDRRPGYDAITQAASGVMSITGPGGGSRVGVAIADLLAGLHAAQGILAALYRRERSGKGGHVEVSMQESMLSALTYQAGVALNTDGTPRAMGNAHPSICPYETVQTQDGPFMLACGNDGQFARLCDLLELPELPQDPRFRTNPDRVTHRPELIPILEGRFREHPAAHWDAELDRIGVPGGPVLDLKQAVSHPQLKARGAVLQHEHPTAGLIRTLASGARLDGQVSGRTEPPPRLGEHGRDILLQAGLDPAEIDHLVQSGVVALEAH